MSNQTATQITLFIMLQFFIVLFKTKIKGSYKFECPIGYKIIFYIIIFSLIIIGGWLMYNSPKEDKKTIIQKSINGLIGISSIYLVGCFHIILNDSLILTPIAYSFGKLKIIKYFWSENQMKEEAINYIKKTYDIDVLQMLDINKIVNQNNNDIERLHKNIDKTVIEKQDQLKSWSFRFWNLFGIAELSYGQTANSLGTCITTCIGTYLLHGTGQVVFGFCLKKIINLSYFIKNSMNSQTQTGTKFPGIGDTLGSADIKLRNVMEE